MNKEESTEESLGTAKELAKNINKTKIIGISEMMKLGSTKKLFAYFLIFHIFWISFVTITNLIHQSSFFYSENLLFIFAQRLVGELYTLNTLLYIISYFLLYLITVRKFKSHTQIALVTFISSLIVFGGAIIVKFIFRFTPVYSLFIVDPMLEYAIVIITMILPSAIISREYFKKAMGKDEVIGGLNNL